jgi:hypothetical protein
MSADLNLRPVEPRLLRKLRQHGLDVSDVLAADVRLRDIQVRRKQFEPGLVVRRFFESEIRIR